MSQSSTTQPGAGPVGEAVGLDTPLGSFAALRRDGAVRVRNIRYARADRFAPPEAVDPDPGESAALQRTLFACPQPPSAADEVYGPQLTGATFTEDCLRLSITRPADLTGPAPVLVWVHGGAYVSGAGDLPGYDPTALCREHGMVVVNVTYRLGALGFFGSPEAPDGGGRPGGRTANLGLLDIVEALRWVHRHVAAFGGDPERVTVLGQSAGADLIAHVLGADGTEGLVQRAILQSAPFGIRGGRTEIHERMAGTVGDLDPTGAVEDVLDAQRRAAAAVAGMNDRSGMPFAPEYGRAPLPPEDELRATWRRRAPGTELLVTWMAQDGSAFVQLDPKGRALRAKPLVGPALFRLVSRRVTDALFRRGAKTFATDMADAGAAVVSAEITARPVGNPLGATHAVELGLLFPHTERWAEAPVVGPDGAAHLVEAGRELRAAWAEFATTGRLSTDRVRTGTGWSGGLRVVARS
ncbi:carboxylesterase family protein [Isoptericola halotolerans]|uniref:Carboxylic ester hydrolase n=1 Tax=Isoptericola halotolerans TaxID=300560 RepID=A0ABX2A479_9MICO|nr:carboxylesterase family protein [Isoptericola halotolerans]NOV96391.1 para-nitrobenzyl esterase [Isoptericola halotolerans]